VPIIYLFFPETKGLELEDVDRLFAGEEEPATRDLFKEKQPGVSSFERKDTNVSNGV
jgi:hypothetical protein